MIKFLGKCPKWIQKLCMYDKYVNGSESERKFMEKMDRLGILLAIGATSGIVAMTIHFIHM